MLDTPNADFSDEQKRYLEGFMSGLQVGRVGRALGPAGGGSAPAGPSSEPEPIGPDAAGMKAQARVLREGRTIDRSEIIATLWAEGADDIPNERTIDVHVRRLRSKLGAYEDIVRTVRGAGYRFDRHADVTIRWASTPSPDVF